MKIRITSIFKNTFTKIINICPSVKLERKIDSYLVVLNRNKLKTPVTDTIDDVIKFTKTLDVKHHIYY